MILAFLVGVALTAWVLTCVAVAYTLWRYTYQPWKVIRADIAALNTKVDAHVRWTRETLTTRRLAAMTDEEVASIERRYRAQSAARVAKAEAAP